MKTRSTKLLIVSASLALTAACCSLTLGAVPSPQTVTLLAIITFFVINIILWQLESLSATQRSNVQVDSDPQQRLEALTSVKANINDLEALGKARAMVNELAACDKADNEARLLEARTKLSALERIYVYRIHGHRSDSLFEFRGTFEAFKKSVAGNVYSVISQNLVG